jgi:hypothetical protein
VEELGSLGMHSGGERERAEDAVRHIGTSAVPYLLVWMQYEPAAWRNTLNNSACLSKVRNWRILEDTRFIRQLGATLAFQTSLPGAEDAIPELGRMLNNAHTPESAERAVDVLAYLGGAGLPPMIEFLTNTHGLASLTNSRGAVSPATYVLHRLNSLEAVPSLPEMLTSPDWNWRNFATNALAVGTGK